MLADRMRKSPLETLEKIERLRAKLNERIAQLERADHLPRTKPLPDDIDLAYERTLNIENCDESCPTCALFSKYYPRLFRLAKPERAALAEYAHQSAQQEYRLRQVNRANASKLRGKRGPNAETKLKLFGLQCVQKIYPDITAERLCGMLEVEPLTFDDDDIQLIDGIDTIVFRDLSEQAPIASAAIKKSSLRTYLLNARKS